MPDPLPGLPRDAGIDPLLRIRVTGLVLLLCSLFLLGGCASSGFSGGGYSDDAFQAGKVRLACGFSCAGSWNLNRQQAREYYEEQDWQALARVVGDIGYGSDLGYYYLGRAAEGTGHSAAALQYYELARAANSHCSTGINRCGGLDVAAAVSERVAVIEANMAAAEKQKPRGQPVRDQRLMAAQATLAELGFYAGRADGLYGPKTRAALLSFQEQRGLPQTGKLDDATNAALQDSQPLAPQPGEATGVGQQESEQLVTPQAGPSASEPAVDAGPVGKELGGVVVSSTDLMDAPDIFSNVIRPVPKGRRVTVISKEEDWYKVAFDGDVGFIYADYIR